MDERLWVRIKLLHYLVMKPAVNTKPLYSAYTIIEGKVENENEKTLSTRVTICLLCLDFA
jgi:hypothetical protein